MTANHHTQIQVFCWYKNIVKENFAFFFLAKSSFFIVPAANPNITQSTHTVLLVFMQICELLQQFQIIQTQILIFFFTHMVLLSWAYSKKTFWRHKRFESIHTVHCLQLRMTTPKYLRWILLSELNPTPVSDRPNLNEFHAKYL